MIQFQNEDVTVFQSAIFQTTSTVVQTKDLVLLVDPTWLPHEIEEIQKYVSQIRNGRKLYLLFTHGDFDHIIGYQAFPDAITIGSKGMDELSDKEEMLALIRDFDRKYYIERNYSILFPQLDIVIEREGKQVAIGETRLTFCLAPGHTQDGLFTIIEPLGIWIAGDYLSDFELPFLYHSSKEYLETLEKAREIMRKIKPSLLIPGHGKVTTDHDEMRRRIATSHLFLQRLIDAVLEENPSKLDQLGKEYSFPSSFTMESHKKNIEMIRREFFV